MGSYPGRVIGVGYEPSDSGKTVLPYISVKIRLSPRVNPGLAEKVLATYTRELLSKDVTIFTG